MAGQVGRPRKSPGEPKSLYTKRSSTQPQYLNGFTGRSTEQIFRVSPDPKILIGKIEDDYRLISKDKTKKMSAITLKYLKDTGLLRRSNTFYIVKYLKGQKKEQCQLRKTLFSGSIQN